MYTGAQIGNILSNCLSGFIMRYIPGGWPNVFYFFGIVSIIWFLLWCMFVYNDPNSHPFISDEERAYLKRAIGRLERKKVWTVFSQYSSVITQYELRFLFTCTGSDAYTMEIHTNLWASMDAGHCWSRTRLGRFYFNQRSSQVHE